MLLLNREKLFLHCIQNSIDELIVYFSGEILTQLYRFVNDDMRMDIPKHKAENTHPENIPVYDINSFERTIE
jgi:hypothetical protein